MTPGFGFSVGDFVSAIGQQALCPWFQLAERADYITQG